MTLRELLDALAQPGGVSGSELAARFGITRAAVWKRIVQLREAGLVVEASAGRGYRLAQPLELLDAQAIRNALSPSARTLLADLRIETEIDSTSDALLRAAQAGAASGSACCAERQSAGRGRRGRRWQSPIAANVYVSVLWRFDAGLSGLAGLSLAAGVAVAEALRAMGLQGVGLKWPNDLLVDGDKLGGILVDAAGEWAGPCHAVIGIGLNVRMPDASAVEIDQPWTEMSRWLEPLPSRSMIVAALLDHLLPALQQFARDGLAGSMARYQGFDALSGREVIVHEAGRDWPAFAEGIEPDGRLRVRDVAGGLHRLSAAEVSVRRTVRA
jgi:BirA family biotin operon repressor/biotin-[acetyl-CoA-carboxylase] ligase